MSTTETTLPSNPGGAPAARTAPFAWSVRREIWENRSLYIAPAALAALFLLGNIISLFGLRHRAPQVDAMAPAQQHLIVVAEYYSASAAIMVVAFFVAFFYCLGALYNERRDRSILFWKSLPVSDVTAVLAKASIPLAVLPIIAFVTIVALQWAMLAVNALARLALGFSPHVLFANLNLLEMQGVLLYSLATLAVWHAPVYGWLLLVSAWAKKTPILWAVLPWVGLGLVAKIAFQTDYIGTMLLHRLFGGISQGFDLPMVDESKLRGASRAAAITRGNSAINAVHIDPMKFLSSPDVWIGLVLAVAFVAGAVWLRRTREAI
jgi:ABC-2 type transport system permease protein